MKKFIVPVTWLMYGEYVIEAENSGEAIKKAAAEPFLPPNGMQVDDSLMVDLNEVKEQPDEEDF